MTSRNLFNLAACLAPLASILIATSGHANNLLSTPAVGAASVSAPNLSLKFNLSQQVKESLRAKDKPTVKAVPEPVCNDHHDADKMLILGGTESVPM